MPDTNVLLRLISMKTSWVLCISCFVTALVVSNSLHTQDRVALLLANSDYGEHKLPEAKANVEKLAKALESAGFTVTVKENIEKDFRKVLEPFT
jgi:adenine C2-methylase RlmN of 23S rRNA A2503 and tRNA A37